MKWCLFAIALLLLGAGGVALVSESRALSQLEDKRAGFANGNGFAAARDAQNLLKAVMANDALQLGEVVDQRLAERPFDPLFWGLKAEMLAKRDLLVGASLLDQARAIAPRDPRVRALRDGLQRWLQDGSLPSSQLAE